MPYTALAAAALNAYSSYQANAQSKKLMQKQFHYQKKMWEMENEYNKPVNQMARLEEAGLNPNLVYGNGATALGGSMGSVSQPSAKELDISPLDELSQYQSIVNMEEQRKNIQSGTKQIDNSIQNQNLQTAADLAVKEQQVLNMQSQRAQTQANTLFALEQVNGQRIANGINSIELGNIGFYGGKEQYKNSFIQNQIEQKAFEDRKNSLYGQLSAAFYNGIYEPVGGFWHKYGTTGTYWNGY